MTKRELFEGFYSTVLVIGAGVGFGAWVLGSSQGAAEASTYEVYPTPTRESNLTIQDKIGRDQSNDIFERVYFGYPVLCGMLNTTIYGNGGSVDPGEPIFDSASDIFGAMGPRVIEDDAVMVIKGQELSFRDSKTGALYSVDANGTIYCQAKK